MKKNLQRSLFILLVFLVIQTQGVIPASLAQNNKENVQKKNRPDFIFCGKTLMQLGGYPTLFFLCYKLRFPQMFTKQELKDLNVAIEKTTATFIIGVASYALGKMYPFNEAAVKNLSWRERLARKVFNI